MTAGDKMWENRLPYDGVGAALSYPLGHKEDRGYPTDVPE